MLLGVVLHASLSFFPGFWPVKDDTATFDGPYDEILHAIHGFRMPLFFLLSGFFTTMLWRQRGLSGLVAQRAKRVALPLALAMVTIVPLVGWVSDDVITDRADNLLISSYVHNTSAVESLLANGANPNEPRGGSGEAPLHAAALVGNAQIAELLIEAGANPEALDDKGDSPLGWAFFAGSAAVADTLVAAGHPDFRPAGGDWDDIEGWGFGARELDQDVIRLDSWVASFHHLWFLWFVLWLAAGFVTVAALAGRSEGESTTASWSGRLMWLLIPLTLLPQYLMGERGAAPVFGPDTSTGLVPLWHVLAYYALFFAFGALAYGRHNRAGTPVIEAAGRGSMFILPVTFLVVFPVALVLTFESHGWLTASVAQVIYTWAMIFGLLGAFRAVLATPRRGVRYLSDSSYWIYLVHVPLVIWIQAQISGWNLPSGVKFVGLNVSVVAVSLLTYQLCVRYTPIGTMLNGKRVRPPRRTSTSVS